ncbi:MAG: diaminopimelate epimerase [Candidatus Aminicenantia bacterium]
MKLVKAQVLGNDFLVIDQKEVTRLKDLNSFARIVCDRHYGIGADGLIITSMVNKERNEASFRIFNHDGTEAEVSGNGLRCAAAYLYYQGLVESNQIKFSTSAGIRISELLEKEDTSFSLRIDMGIPVLSSREIPFDDGSEYDRVVDYCLTIGQKKYQITALSIGNPHCVVFVSSFPSRIEWHQLGGEIESHPFFPHRTNVEFVKVINRNVIQALFWERGVGETLSSGSGACASAVASILKGLTDRKVKVKTSSGELIVEWKKEKIYQVGPAEIIFEIRWVKDIFE